MINEACLSIFVVQANCVLHGYSKIIMQNIKSQLWNPSSTCMFQIWYKIPPKLPALF